MEYYSLSVFAFLALSKWAVEALAEALRLELYNFDIKVSILEPGNYLGGTQILNNKRVKELTDRYITLNL